MKHTSMKVPSLGKLYEQKNGYEAHKQKLLQIKSDRKAHLQDFSKVGQMNQVRRNLQKFGQNFNSRSL